MKKSIISISDFCKKINQPNSTEELLTDLMGIAYEYEGKEGKAVAFEASRYSGELTFSIIYTYSKGNTVLQIKEQEQVIVQKSQNVDHEEIHAYIINFKKSGRSWL